MLGVTCGLRGGRGASFGFRFRMMDTFSDDECFVCSDRRMKGTSDEGAHR
jgi:hypothetical protein